MKRLDDETLPPFLTEPDVAIVLFGAPSGRPTLRQAQELALIWTETPDEARFGHIDATANDVARANHGIRVLPTTLVFQDGRPVARFEGVAPRWRIEAAVRSLNCAVAA